MHSAIQSRRAARREMANVGIGDDFDSSALRGISETKKKVDKYLREHGSVPWNKDSRLRRLWERWKSGGLEAGVAEAVYKNNKRAFDRWSKEELN